MKLQPLAVLTLSLAACVLVASPASPVGAEERPPHPAWAPSIDAGLAQAKERGVAFMVALNMDRERGNQQMVDEVYSDPVFHEAAGKCVVAMASMFQHRLIADPTTGKQVCERFGSVTCDEHRTIEDTVRQVWLKRSPKDDVESPRHIFVSPDGTILFQRIWTIEAPDLAALMTRASELCTPERLAAWDTAEGRIERALDPIAAVREIALAELIAENDPDIDERLAAEAKKAKDPLVAGSVLGAFARADDETRRGLAHDALSHKAPEIRMLVAYAMGQSGAQDHLKPLLARLGKEKDAKAQGSMARAVGTLGGASDDAKEAKAAKKALLKMVAKTDTPGRDHALVAISPWAADDDVTPALMKVLNQGGSQDTRAAAVWSLGLSGKTAVRVVLREVKADVSRRDWRLKRALEMAVDRLMRKDVEGYDQAIDRLLPDPAVDDGDDEDERGGRGRDR